MLGATETITIWNRFKNPSTKRDLWFRHAVKNCSWEKTNIRNLSGTTTNLADIFEVLIDENLKYKTYKDWIGLTESEKLYFFTLNAGDLVAKGELYDEIIGISPDTVSEIRERLFPSVFTIKTVFEANQNYKNAPHYEITGV